MFSLGIANPYLSVSRSELTFARESEWVYGMVYKMGLRNDSRSYSCFFF